MKGPYEFLQPLKRLMDAQQRHERNVVLLNAALLSIAIYCLALVIKMRRRPDIFHLLGEKLSEKARTGYDNSDLESLPMQSLAQELKVSLNSIKPTTILDSREIKSRALFLLILLGAATILSKSEIVNPSDFQALTEIRDKALSAFEDKAEEETPSYEINLTGNIFGRPSLAVLNENKMDIMLYPGMGAGSLARNTDPVERAFQKSQVGEVTAVPSELYIESLPPENRHIIKRYFLILSENG